MDYLWSPWRFNYVSAARSGGPDCIFCTKPADGRDEENLIVYRGKLAYVLLNLFPYTSGHLMIAPYQHAPTLETCAPDALAELMELTQAAERNLRAIYGAPGYNIGMNIGESAGAGVAGHLHMHVLPRWPGDVNFMTSIGETRVLPEDLVTTWRKLAAAFRGG